MAKAKATASKAARGKAGERAKTGRGVPGIPARKVAPQAPPAAPVQPAAATSLLVAVDWTEHDWGQRPEGATLHLSVSEAEAYIAWFTKSLRQQSGENASGGCTAPGKPYAIDAPQTLHTEVVAALTKPQNGDPGRPRAFFVDRVREVPGAEGLRVWIVRTSDGREIASGPLTPAPAPLAWVDGYDPEASARPAIQELERAAYAFSRSSCSKGTPTPGVVTARRAYFMALGEALFIVQHLASWRQEPRRVQPTLPSHWTELLLQVAREAESKGYAEERIARGGTDLDDARRDLKFRDQSVVLAHLQATEALKRKGKP
jgi:hypothetical protein